MLSKLKFNIIKGILIGLLAKPENIEMVVRFILDKTSPMLSVTFERFGDAVENFVIGIKKKVKETPNELDDLILIETAKGLRVILVRFQRILDRFLDDKS